MRLKLGRYLAVASTLLATVLVAISLLSLFAPRHGWASLVVPGSHVGIDPGGGYLQISNDSDIDDILQAVGTKRWISPAVVSEHTWGLKGARWQQVDFAGGDSKWACTFSAAFLLALSGLLMVATFWLTRRLTAASPADA